MDWPISERLRAEYRDKVLHEGIPDWLWSGLVPWVQNRMSDHRGVSADGLQEVERILRRPLAWKYGADSAWRSLVGHMRDDHDYALDLLGLLVIMSNQDYAGEAARRELERVLRSGGSAWHIRFDEDGRGYLERRVAEEQVERFTSVSGEGRPGSHLRTAWSALYGRTPDVNTAYGEAVKAVEAAGASTISPANDRTTLGTMIRDFRARPEKWDVPLGSSAEQGRDALLGMMEAVWHGQHNRHGTPDETRPTSVTAQEAEAALHTALTLVQLFISGLVVRSGNT